MDPRTNNNNQPNQNFKVKSRDIAISYQQLCNELNLALSHFKTISQQKKASKISKQKNNYLAHQKFFSSLDHENIKNFLKKNPGKIKEISNISGFEFLNSLNLSPSNVKHYSEMLSHMLATKLSVLKEKLTSSQGRDLELTSEQLEKEIQEIETLLNAHATNLSSIKNLTEFSDEEKLEMYSETDKILEGLAELDGFCFLDTNLLKKNRENSSKTEEFLSTLYQSINTKKNLLNKTKQIKKSFEIHAEILEKYELISNQLYDEKNKKWLASQTLDLLLSKIASVSEQNPYNHTILEITAKLSTIILSLLEPQNKEKTEEFYSLVEKMGNLLSKKVLNEIKKLFDFYTSKVKNRNLSIAQEEKINKHINSLINKFKEERILFTEETSTLITRDINSYTNKQIQENHVSLFGDCDVTQLNQNLERKNKKLLEEIKKLTEKETHREALSNLSFLIENAVDLSNFEKNQKNKFYNELQDKKNILIELSATIKSYLDAFDEINMFPESLALDLEKHINQNIESFKKTLVEYRKNQLLDDLSKCNEKINMILECYEKINKDSKELPNIALETLYKSLEKAQETIQDEFLKIHLSSVERTIETVKHLEDKVSTIIEKTNESIFDLFDSLKHENLKNVVKKTEAKYGHLIDDRPNIEGNHEIFIPHSSDSSPKLERAEKSNSSVDSYSDGIQFMLLPPAVLGKYQDSISIQERNPLNNNPTR